jgi:integrase
MDLAANSVTFGNVGLADLKTSHVETWVKSMQASGLQPTTIRTRFANVRAAIRAAVKDQAMGRDVADGVRLPATRKSAAAMAVPTPEQVGAILADDGEYSALFAACAFAGLRRGEACALQVGDVDFLRRELHVRRQVQFTDDGEMEIRRPKYGEERTISIPDGLTAILARHIERFTPGDNADRWLFPAGLTAPSLYTLPPWRVPGVPLVARWGSATACTICATFTPPA